MAIQTLKSGVAALTPVFSGAVNVLFKKNVATVLAMPKYYGNPFNFEATKAVYNAVDGHGFMTTAWKVVLILSQVATVLAILDFTAGNAVRLTLGNVYKFFSKRSVETYNKNLQPKYQWSPVKIALVAGFVAASILGYRYRAQISNFLPKSIIKKEEPKGFFERIWKSYAPSNFKIGVGAAVTLASLGTFYTIKKYGFWEPASAILAKTMDVTVKIFSLFTCCCGKDRLTVVKAEIKKLNDQLNDITSSIGINKDIVANVSTAKETKDLANSNLTSLNEKKEALEKQLNALNSEKDDLISKAETKNKEPITKNENEDSSIKVDPKEVIKKEEPVHK
jgi:hypothetical protein